jgi:preprotein translocase subunit SecA
MILSSILKKIFGSRHQRVIKGMTKIVKKINAMEPAYEAFNDEALKAKTQEFRDRYAKGETLDQLLPEAFATVREASKRTLGLRHFDVQLIGGMVLHSGKIAEMRTGEGKTLSSTLPAYLNAISGKGVHIVTPNDYLAKRDAEWNRPIYHFLGMTVGINFANMAAPDKRAAYAADITYSTNNELGFDYLRDNMAFTLADKVQRELNFAVIDEVDSILIDEARTPLIISGPSEESADAYIRINQIIPQLTKRTEENGPGDFYLDEKSRQAFLTEEGHQHVEELLTKEGLLQEHESLYDAKNISLNHYLNAALRAHKLYNKDVDYIVKDNEIIIVDEHTGRTMVGRRWSEGLHQAIEAKENVKIQQENQTLASITFQNYFRLYKKLSGMTGTADTEAFEFQQIYNLEVVVIPTNRPMVRQDFGDKIYLTTKDKFAAVIQEIKQCHQSNQPVLVGTAAIETSEYLSSELTKENIPHQVLNAKFHDKEAKIIAEAGRPGVVTIATNMAGRGTDIILGGNLQADLAVLTDPTPEQIEAVKTEWQRRHDAVIAAGGLAVIGSERHESRRIDNQLRGRSGRQGDPGYSRFYLSFEDNLMRIFASDRVVGLMRKLGMKEGEAIEHPWASRAIEKAQRKVEGFHFDVRKQLLEYDDVANEQRHVIYDKRNELLSTDDISAEIKEMRQAIVTQLVQGFIPPNTLEEQWDVPGLEQQLLADFRLSLSIHEKLQADSSLQDVDIIKLILDDIEKGNQDKEGKLGHEGILHLEKSLMLQILDSHWRDHLAAMDHLRQGIHLRGYAQKNPKQEYKREAFNLFLGMLDSVNYEVIQALNNVQLQEAPADPGAQIDVQRRITAPTHIAFKHDGFNEGQFSTNAAPGVSRNDPCPCGSGKRYKQCHGNII